MTDTTSDTIAPGTELPRAAHHGFDPERYRLQVHIDQPARYHLEQLRQLRQAGDWDPDAGEKIRRQAADYRHAVERDHAQLYAAAFQSPPRMPSSSVSLDPEAQAAFYLAALAEAEQADDNDVILRLAPITPDPVRRTAYLKVAADRGLLELIETYSTDQMRSYVLHEREHGSARTAERIAEIEALMPAEPEIGVAESPETRPAPPSPSTTPRRRRRS